MILGNFEVFGSMLVALTILAVNGETGIFGSVTDQTNTTTICKKQYRRTASRYVSYREMYKPYGPFSTVQLTRWNYQWETYAELAPIDVCCDGYEPIPSANILTCMPVCKDGCEHGSCYKPNVCKCDYGYREQPDKLSGDMIAYISCVPDCSSDCHGGYCSAPQICTCFEGYHSAKDYKSCEPTCSVVDDDGLQGCGKNALCIGPNVCKCDNGYVTFVSPSPSSSSSSSPNGNETVIPHDVPKTFNTSDVTCRPVCYPECEKNATCVSPNECRCSAGYRNATLTTARGTNDSLCLPVCEKDCVNGYCGYPNKCICHSGYKPDVRYVDESVCEPICKDGCVNGVCTLPDYCQCNDGYEKLSSQAGLHDGALPNVCAPVCPGQCLNGHCVAPGYCLCDPGHVLTLLYSNETMTNATDAIDSDDPIRLPAQQSCQPLCEPSCPSGSLCTAPNQCQLQPDRHQDLIEFATNVTSTMEQNVNSTKYCSGNGIFDEKNRSCSCHYGWSGSTCAERSFCAIVLPNDNRTDENIILRSVVLHNNGSLRVGNSINSEETNENSNWMNSKCKEECRNFALKLLLHKNQSDDTMTECRRVELQPELFNGTNETTICLINIRSPCNVEKSNNTSGKVAVVVSGYFVLFAILVSLGSVAIYFIHRKITRMRAIRAVRRMNAMRELAEATESLYATDDSSHQ